MSVVAVAWQRYLNQLDKRPLKTKAVTAAALAGLSDLLAQKISSNAPVNWRRTCALAIFGLVWSGPSNHYWQKLLERLFKGKRDSGTVLKKVLLDQLTYGPLCNVLLLSYLSLFVEGRSWTYSKAKVRQTYPNIQMNGWKLWPIASFINYTYVPLKLRVLFVNCVAFAWSTFLIVQAKAAIKRLTAA
ncbi:hypothetical protein WJX72_009641 [[Myrmecia] bisecta]|uniref:Peroxisomal membrane protein PMP22 n=1 Tax=[Myrmecia] bisecta TaxID=41462 RepID=A0AAW1Q9Q0_9CHLO